VNIAYVAHWDMSRESGVLKKMANQVQTWRQLGHTVRLFALSEHTTPWEGLRDVPVSIIQRGSLARRYARAAELVRQVLAWKPEIVYLRYGTYYPALEWLLARVPTVAEFNGNNLIAARQLPWYRHFYYLITHTRIVRLLRGMVVVSSELVESLRRYGKPVVVLGNSINTNALPHFPPATNPRPRLVFLGWNVTCTNPHGVDKMCWLAERFPDWHLDLIGIEARTRATIEALALPNVTTYPLLTYQEYAPLLAQADVALGSLALYRRGLGENSAIKTAEYLAAGLATIVGYRETNFPPDVPYLLQIPAAVDNVERYVSQIEQFVARWQGRRVDRAAVQPWIDAGVIEQRRLAFLEQIR
jgi:hypothetical protein